MNEIIFIIEESKEGGFAAASALALFGEKASLPGAILSVFLIIFLILIGLKPRKKMQNEPGTVKL